MSQLNARTLGVKRLIEAEKWKNVVIFNIPCQFD